MAVDAVTPDAVAPATGRTDALTTIAPFVEFRVDDVLVRHLALPGLTRVSLSFGVGTRDETPGRLGVTALVAEAVAARVAALPDDILEITGVTQVSLDSTSFSAEGTPEEVTAYLRAVCAALSNLDESRLPAARRLVASQAPDDAGVATAAGHAYCCGLVGPGLTLLPREPHRITDAEARHHLATYFTAANATLAVVGPMPEALTLGLPPGGPDSIERARVEWTGKDRAVWVEADVPMVTMVLPLPTDTRHAELYADILQDRFTTTLHHAEGLTPQVGHRLTSVDDVCLAVFTFASGAADRTDLTRQVYGELHHLARQGPTVEELQRVRRRTRRDLGSPYLMEHYARQWQHSAGRCMTYYEPLEHATVRDAASVESVRDGLREAADRVVVLVPRDVRPFGSSVFEREAPIDRSPWCGRYRELPEGKVYRPSRWRRWRNRQARQTLVVSDDFVALKGLDRVIHVIALADVVTAEEERDGTLELTGVNRCVIRVDRRVFGGRAVRRVRDLLQPPTP